MSLDDLCKKAVDVNLRGGVFDHVRLTNASSLIGTVDSIWRKADLAK